VTRRSSLTAQAHPSFYESVPGGLPEVRTRVEALQRRFNEESKVGARLLGANSLPRKLPQLGGPAPLGATLKKTHSFKARQLTRLPGILACRSSSWSWCSSPTRCTT
jgi:hypothetical protein